jgi:hypothetical protein
MPLLLARIRLVFVCLLYLAGLLLALPTLALLMLASRFYDEDTTEGPY